MDQLDRAETEISPSDLSSQQGEMQEQIPPSPVLQPPPSPALVPAGFTRRALAFMIDLFMITCLYFFLALFGTFGIFLASGDRVSPEGYATPFFVAGFLLFTGYFTFFHAMEGQTPAKKIVRIKVVREDGARLSHGAILVRASLGYFLSSSFFGAGFFMALFGSKKRALHDFLTGSFVVLSD